MPVISVGWQQQVTSDDMGNMQIIAPAPARVQLLHKFIIDHHGVSLFHIMRQLGTIDLSFFLAGGA